MTTRQVNFRLAVGLLMFGLLIGWFGDARAYIPTSDQGENIGQACGDPKAKVIRTMYVNGVLTTYLQAQENYAAFVAFMHSNDMVTLINVEQVCLSLGFQYNPTSTFISDFIESGQQLDKLLTPDLLSQYFVLGTVGLVLGSPGVAVLLAALGALAADDHFIQQDVVSAHASQDEAYLKACRNVLLVPHSQGNLYVHQAHDLLYAKLKAQLPSGQEGLLDGIRIVGVGSPDTTNAVQSSPGYSSRHLHRTNETDLVMGAVKLLPGTRLPDNTDWSVFPNSLIASNAWKEHTYGHAFTGYLAFNQSKLHIFGDLKTQIQGLPRGGCPQFSLDMYVAPSIPAAATTTTADITIVRTTAVSSETVTVSTGVGSAQPNVDYIPLTQQSNVLFSEDLDKATVKVTILKNAARTTSLTVPLLLTQVAVGTPLGAKITAVLEIPPDADSCPDPSPNITIFDWSTGIVYESKPVASFNLSIPGGSSISATGSKGNVGVSASTPGNGASIADVTVRYRDTFIVTSPGKTGPGQAVASFSASNSADVSCTDSQDNFTQAYSDAQAAYSVPGAGGVGVGGTSSLYKNCFPTTIPGGSTSSQSISFTYGASQYFDVYLRTYAWAPLLNNTSASSSAGIGYSVTANDPDAKVTWCRATP